MAEKRDRYGRPAVEGPGEVATPEARPCPPREKEGTQQGGGQALLPQEDHDKRASHVSMEMTSSPVMEMLWESVHAHQEDDKQCASIVSMEMTLSPVMEMLCAYTPRRR